MDTNSYINYVLSMLFRKITVPGDYHGQVHEIKQMLKDDVSGLVDSLTDFAVNSASVDYNIVTDNKNLNIILEKWLKTLNSGYNGQVPIGIRNLAKEYFRERWKGSSFPVLKFKWENVDGVYLPTKIFFIDGGDIYAREIEDDDELKLISYNYYIGETDKKEYKLSGNNVIINRPYGRWFEKYPTPFLIKRGIFHNWKIIQSVKKKEIEILEQVIPYMLLVKKGTEALAVNHIKIYKDSELKEVKRKFQTLMDEIKTTTPDNQKVKAPFRATGFDEDINHIIPQIKNMFENELFANAERNILAGLGFIDVVDAVSTSRRESILNPKGFIEEIKSGVDDFKQILYYLMIKIKEKNDNKRKYMNSDFYVASSPVRGFMTDKFKQEIRLLWKHGKISDQTYCELVGEMDFRTEVMRREKEVENDIPEKMYPNITENREGFGVDIPGKQPDEDINGNPIPDDKIGDRRQDYDISGKLLEIAPYKNIKDLPSRVKDNMTKSLQRTFLRVFNNAYETYGNDTQASKVAWALIKKIAKKNKDGKWVKTRARVKISKAMIEQVMEDFEEDALGEIEDKLLKEKLRKQNIEIAEKKKELLDRLLNPKKEKDNGKE